MATFIVDEADRMLDMGFIRDVRKLVAMLPRERQSMLFSATMPDDIVKLTHDMLRSPHASRSRPKARPRRIEEKLYFVRAPKKASCWRAVETWR